MVKSIAAMISFALFAASIIALPGFAPEVEANEAGVLVNRQVVLVQPAAVNCSNAVWPNLPSSCLQRADSTGNIVEARLVTARR
jgi:hypothetical protein